MGQEVMAAVSGAADMELIGAVDLEPPPDSLKLPDGVPFSTDLDCFTSGKKPNVMVDFTVAAAAMPAIRTAIKNGIRPVIGTSGLKQQEIDELDRLARKHCISAALIPNFAMGAVLMMHMARLAARYMDTAEIIEAHHPAKLDAPSGTAIATAEGMFKERGKEFDKPLTKDSDSRGQDYGGIAVHSLRLPGIVARQEVVFGGPGETLSIKHDSIDRKCFMPGVLLAIREIGKHEGLIYGLEGLLGL
jgi:4-hydroxy-tetrahydrodipicolinate reductase